MNILFLCYWGINEGLTSATVFPHLRILGQFSQVNTISFCTIERDGHYGDIDLGIEKVQHYPLVSKDRGNVFLTKWNDFRNFPKTLKEIVKENKIDRIICRSSLAGALGHKLSQYFNIPYYVESFEPHAEYMLESGVWSKYDPRYWINKQWEKKQLKQASGIMPVAENFTKHLKQNGVAAEKLQTVPCAVNHKNFAFDKHKRKELRQILGIDEKQKVGVYVGKFGGIYYDDEAFELFKAASEFFNNDLFLIILSPQDKNWVIQKCKRAGLQLEKLFVDCKPHEHIPAYLSAADFAFSTIKPAECRKYCSPIKNGEYWANGLPVLLTDGVGDDHRIIKDFGGGATFNLKKKNTKAAFQQIVKEMKQTDYRKKTQELAIKFRSFELAKKTYERFLFLP